MCVCGVCACARACVCVCVCVCARARVSTCLHGLCPTHLLQDVPDLAEELLWNPVQRPIQSPPSSPHAHTLHQVLLLHLSPHHPNVMLQLDRHVSLAVSDNGDLRNSLVVPIASERLCRCAQAGNTAERTNTEYTTMHICTNLVVCLHVA